MRDSEYINLIYNNIRVSRKWLPCWTAVIRENEKEKRKYSTAHNLVFFFKKKTKSNANCKLNCG